LLFRSFTRVRCTDTKIVQHDEKLEWQSPSDKKESNLEMIAFKKQLDDEIKELEEQVSEIVKLPDFQYYHKVLQNRISLLEQRYLKSDKPWNKFYLESVDKEIEKVIYETQEEFHRYYKKRDEWYISLAQEQAKLSGSNGGLIDPQSLKIISEKEEKLYLKDQEQLKLLANDLPDIVDEIDDDEIDDDEIDENKIKIKKDTAKSKQSKNLGKESIQQPKEDPITGKLYKGYEDIGLYRTETDNSSYAGYDRIMAHLKARYRENEKKKDKSRSEQKLATIKKEKIKEMKERDFAEDYSPSEKIDYSNDIQGWGTEDYENQSILKQLNKYKRK